MNKKYTFLLLLSISSTQTILSTEESPTPPRSFWQRICDCKRSKKQATGAKVAPLEEIAGAGSSERDSSSPPAGAGGPTPHRKSILKPKSPQPVFKTKPTTQLVYLAPLIRPTHTGIIEYTGEPCPLYINTSTDEGLFFKYIKLANKQQYIVAVGPKKEDEAIFPMNIINDDGCTYNGVLTAEDQAGAKHKYLLNKYLFAYVNRILELIRNTKHRQPHCTIIITTTSRAKKGPAFKQYLIEDIEHDTMPEKKQIVATPLSEQDKTYDLGIVMLKHLAFLDITIEDLEATFRVSKNLPENKIYIYGRNFYITLHM